MLGAARDLSAPSFPGDVRAASDLPAEATEHPFNLGILTCIGKRPIGQEEGVGDVYDAAGTRPLSIVDTANRLIASAYRLRWEPHLASWVSPLQRGFLPGRSLLANVVDVETAAITAALTDKEPAILLFDIAAAFPSLSQRFMQAVLAHIGLPRAALQVVASLYDGGRCVITAGGTRHPGFSLGAGIRQGCPLSPLLFAVALDPFLRRVARRIPSLLIRAYADDMAAVTKDLIADLPILAEEFARLSAVANLQVNVNKTILIPLWLGTDDRIRRRVAHACPHWADLQVQRTGKHLG